MLLARNILANYFGQAWIAIINVAFVPIYIKYLGVEAYGLVGVFAILQAWFGLLDMGISQTLNREMARFLSGERSNVSIRNLLRSLEIIIGCVAIFVVLSIWLTSDWLSVHWLNTNLYSPKQLAELLFLFGLIISLRLCESLYRAVLLGLQKQVILNYINIALETIRAVGAICVLEWVDSTADIFFIWQGIISMTGLVVLATLAYSLLPKISISAKFSMEDIVQIKGFACNVLLINLTQVLLTYSDKIILSKMVSLEIFGFYVLAGTISQVIYQVTIPVSQACYPKLSELFAGKKIHDLIRVYRLGSQLISSIAFPFAMVLIFFGEKIIFLWSGNKLLADNVAPICAMLAIGTMLNSIMHMPGILTLAYGWSQYGVRQNLVGIVLILPILPFIASTYGAIGVAWLWIFLNLGYILIGAQYVHNKLIPNEKWGWYSYSVISPALTTLVVTVFFYLIQPKLLSGILGWLWVGLAIFTIILTVGLSQPIIRQYLFKKV